MNKKKRFYVILNHNILLNSSNKSFPDPEIFKNQKFSHEIEMGDFDNIKCFAASPVSSWEQPEGFDFFDIKTVVRNTPRYDLKLAGLAGYLIDWISTTQYCGRCGARNQLQLEERAQKCPNCDLVNYPRFSPAVIVAVIKDDRILLAHNKKFNSGMYSTIAGYLDPGETLEACVQREVWEETGIKVKNIRYFSNQPWLFPASHMIGFTSEYDSGQIKVDGDEIDQAEWFTADNLPQIPGKGSISRQLIDWFVENFKSKST